MEFDKVSAKEPNTPEGLDEAAKKCVGSIWDTPLGEKQMRFFKAGAEWRDRQLNWARDLVQAGIDKPEEAVNILKRLKELL